MVPTGTGRMWGEGRTKMEEEQQAKSYIYVPHWYDLNHPYFCTYLGIYR